MLYCWTGTVVATSAKLRVCHCHALAAAPLPNSHGPPYCPLTCCAVAVVCLQATSLLLISSYVVARNAK